MNNNKKVSRGYSYLPTESGNYWPVLVDANGCKSYINARYPKSYILSDPPFASCKCELWKKNNALWNRNR